MNDLTFKISTPAELSGAQKALAVLEEQITKARLLGKDLEKIEALEKRAAAARASIASFKPPPETQSPQAKATQQQALFNKEAKESQALLQALSSSGIPGVGLAATAAFSVSTAGAAALGLAVAEIVNHYQELKKATEEFMAIQIQLSNAKGIYEGVRDAMREARVEAEAFVKQAYEVAKAEKTIRDSLGETIKAIDSRKSATATLADEQQSLIEAELKSLERRNLLTKEQVAIISVLLDHEAKLAKFRQERAAEVETINAQKKSLADQQAELDKVAPNAVPADEAAAFERTKLKNLEAKEKEAREALRPGSTADEAFQKADRFYNTTLRDQFPDLVGLTKEELDRERERRRFNVENDPTGEGGAYSADQFLRMQEFDKLAANFFELQSKRTEAQQRVVDLPDQIEQQARIVKDREAAAAEIKQRVTEASQAIAELTKTIQAREMELRNNDQLRGQLVNNSVVRSQLAIADAGGFERPAAPGPRTSADFWSKPRGGADLRPVEDQLDRVDSIIGGVIERLANAAGVRVDILERRLNDLSRRLPPPQAY